MRQYKSSLFICRKCKNKWILWMIRENFKKWNQIVVEGCLTFPVSLQWFQVLVPCWAATNACLLTHGIHRDYRKNVFGHQFSTFDSLREHHQGIQSCTTPGETGSVPQATGTGTFFTRDDRQDRGTIPMPTFARRPSTMSLLILVGIPQNFMVGQQRQQIWELQFDKFLNSQSF